MINLKRPPLTKTCQTRPYHHCLVTVVLCMARVSTVREAFCCLRRRIARFACGTSTIARVSSVTMATSIQSGTSHSVQWMYTLSPAHTTRLLDYGPVIWPTRSGYSLGTPLESMWQSFIQMVSMWRRAPAITPVDCGTFTVDTASDSLPGKRDRFVRLCFFQMGNRY
jgi:hypothetical protein